MFRLAEEVGRADLAVHGLVGDDQRLGRPGEEIDADAPEQLALGLGDIGVARPHDHGDGRDGLGAERHGGHRLHAAEDVDLVGAAQVHRGDDRRMRPALERRRAGDDAAHARDLRGHDRHMRRGHHRIAPARDVAADAVHRDVPVPQDDAGKRLDLEVQQGRLLLLREVAHLRLGEADVVEIAPGELGDGALDLLRGEPEACGRPAVELVGELPDRDVAARLDVGEDRLDRLANLRVGGLDGARIDPALEVASHDVLLSQVERGWDEASREPYWH